MTRMKVPPPLTEIFLEHSRFLITSHLRPDGDAIGSQLALAGILEELGKEVVIENQAPIPENFSFLPGAEKISPFGEIPFHPEVAVVLDCPRPGRVGVVEKHLSAVGRLVNIDHHVSNSGYGDVSWVEPGSSSVGEMIYHLLAPLGVKLTRPIALAIYVAILTDMGKFQYMVTPESGARVFRLVAELVDTGLVPYEIYKKVYNLYSVAPLKFLGEALASLEFAAGGQIAFFRVDREMLARYGDGSDVTENLISYPRDIISTRVALLFTELPGGGVKVSFRSKEPEIIDVNRIASRFGGGGHPAAAGAELPQNLDRAVLLVLAAVEEYLENLGDSSGAEGP
ncbi:MAG: DHH family phosphoesterase [Candidatus Erginobacter occultus]|nr:DHH family phosphoesterase [Candidatus Erginobacter occultus]